MKPLKTSFPTGSELPAHRAQRAKRKRGKVGRSYTKLGTSTTHNAEGVRTPGFFPLPITWGNTPVAREILARGGARVASPGKAPRVEFPFPWSPDAGTVVKGCPSVKIGAGQSVDCASLGRSPIAIDTTRYILDGTPAVK